MASVNEWVFGAAEPPMRMVALRAGPVTARFDPFTAQLRYVFFGGKEAVRGIYCAVRDEHWGTVLPTLSEVEIRQREDGFAVRFVARHHRAEIDFRWHGTIEGRSDGTLTFDCEGEAVSPFDSRRTGVCVLHPHLGAAGQPVTVVHSDGNEEAGAFPTLVSPHQPFFDIREIHHPLEGDGSVHISFEGEVFEMEDQRNWTDDSFKTYCRPQEWPQPYRLEAGERMHHRITVRFGGTPSLAEGREPRLRLFPERTHPLPSIGTCGALSESGLSWGHRLTREGDCLRWSGANVQALGIPAEDRVSGVRGDWPDDTVLLCRQGNFTELNRERPFGEVDGVAFPMNPQVHAFDTATMMESVAAQLACLQSATALSPGPVHVGPIYLDSRGVDARHRSLVAAAFVVGSVASLVRGSAASLTYFSDEIVASSPARFVFGDLLEFAGGETFEASLEGAGASPFPPVFALGLQLRGRRAVLLANATPEEVTVDLGAPRTVRLLDGRSPEPREERSEGPLTLRPHAYARIDLEPN